MFGILRFIGGYAGRLALAVFVTFLWFFAHDSFKTFVHFLRDYPMKWLLALVNGFVRNVWNPLIGPYVGIIIPRNTLSNMELLFDSGMFLVVPVIMITIIVVGAILSAIWRKLTGTGSGTAATTAGPTPTVPPMPAGPREPFGAKVRRWFAGPIAFASAIVGFLASLARRFLRWLWSWIWWAIWTPIEFALAQVTKWLPKLAYAAAAVAVVGAGILIGYFYLDSNYEIFRCHTETCRQAELKHAEFTKKMQAIRDKKYEITERIYVEKKEVVTVPEKKEGSGASGEIRTKPIEPEKKVERKHRAVTITEPFERVKPGYSAPYAYSGYPDNLVHPRGRPCGAPRHCH